MPIRRNRRATPSVAHGHGTRSRFSKRIVVATSLIAVVAVALFAVVLTGAGAAPTGPIGVAANSGEESGLANATTPGSTSSSSETASAAPIDTPKVSGVEKVYVSVVDTTPQTSDDVNTGMTKAAVQSTIDKLNSYWSAQSNGEVTIVLGGYETRSLGESTCAPTTALRSEESSAFGGMFASDAWKGTHNHLLVLSAESCSADSFATVGGVGGEIFSGNGIDATTGVEYLLHEFGHNLGFEHADASICTNTTTYDGIASDFNFTSKVCPTREYDDYFDIMGYTVKNATPNLSSPQRVMAGWMSNYVTLTNSSSSYTETVAPLGSNSGTQSLKIVDATSGAVYYVEYRTDSGLDATSAEFNYGLQCDAQTYGYTTCELDSNKTTGAVRVLRVIPIADSNANGTTVLATGLTAGSSDKTKRHTHLNRGDIFTSIDGAFTVKVVALSPTDGATIQVTFAHSTQATTPTTATRVPSKTSVAIAHAAITHGQKAALKITISRSGTSTPTGTIVVTINGKSAGSYTLKAASKGVLSLTTSALAKGKYTITATYTGSSNAKSSGSATVTAS